MDTSYHRRARAWAALDWRPEWPFALLVLVAWVAIFAGSGWSRIWALDPVFAAVPLPAVHYPGHGGHEAPGRTSPLSPPGALGGFLGALAEWALMSVAMMLPVMLPSVGHVGVNSLRRRRQRAMVICVAVYVGIWVGFGVVALAGLRWLRDASGLDRRVLLPAALAIAAAWQLTRCKRRAIFGCRRTRPLPPVGLRADAGCAHFAGVQGWRCVKSCWALMVVMAVGGHASLVLMVAMTALVLMEELTLIGRRLLRPSAGVLAVSAAVMALMGWSPVNSWFSV